MDQQVINITEALIQKGAVIAFAVAIALIVQNVVVRLANKVLDASEVPNASIFINILRTAIWSLAFLSVLRPVFNVDPSGLIAALGVVSVAISLGLQDTISNIVGGLGLMLSRAVRPGDKVTVGTTTGTVTDVTWRSTTLRSRAGDVDVIPNSVLNKTTLTHLDPAKSPAKSPANETMQGQLPIPATMPPEQDHFQSGQNRPLLDPETHLNKNATFDTFVPGDSNRFARTVALAVAEGSGHDFNPLCIYGGSGLGKTHLLNAIGNYALVKDPNLKVRYVTSEEFTNEFIEALADTNQSSGQIKEFNRRYREVDVLLIDDIQFLSGKDATLEQFFHTFNTLHQANKRIVIASDVPPKDLQGFNERLISRFESGLTVDVKPPDLETRIAILRMIATMNGSNIPNDVFNLIAERFTENIRELEGALNRVTAMASLSNQPVTKALAEQTLQDFFTTDVEIKPADIITQVAKYFYLTFDDIVGRSRTKKIALARQIAMYLVRELTSMSLNDIGLVFGGKDHTTVMHAYTRINDEMQEKQEIYNYVTELTLQLKQRSNDK